MTEAKWLTRMIFLETVAGETTSDRRAIPRRCSMTTLRPTTRHNNVCTAILFTLCNLLLPLRAQVSPVWSARCAGTSTRSGP